MEVVDVSVALTPSWILSVCGFLNLNCHFLLNLQREPLLCVVNELPDVRVIGSFLPLVAVCSIGHKYGQNSEGTAARGMILLEKHPIFGHKCTCVGVFRG